MPLINTSTLAVKLLLLAWLLSSCGRKGPLFMQQEPAKPIPASVVPAEKKPLDTNSPGQNQPVQTQTESQKTP